MKSRRFVNHHLKRMRRNLSSLYAPAYVLSKKTPNTSLFSWYSRQLDERPIFTKCVSAGLISSSGNILAQKIKHDQKVNEGKTSQSFQIEWDQVGRFAFLNVIFVAPVLHHWYQFINRAVPGKSMPRVLQRVFWDEFVFSPVYIPVFLGGLWALEGTKPEKIKTMLYNELPSIIAAEWVLWVPTMALTFRYAPVKFQVLVINCVGVIWQTFLSLMASNAHENQISNESAIVEIKKDKTKERAVNVFNVSDIAAIEVNLSEIFNHILESW